MKKVKGDKNDPKALIREAYNIVGISIGECRSIFLDWALSMPLELNTQEVIRAILEQYKSIKPDHPMTQTLQEGLTTLATPYRRGGWRSRRIEDDDIN